MRFKRNPVLKLLFKECGYRLIDNYFDYRQYKEFEFPPKHQDRVLKDDAGESDTSCLIYLNDLEDGDTVFYESKESETPYCSIKPQKGKMIFFPHFYWHSAYASSHKKKILLFKLASITTKKLE